MSHAIEPSWWSVFLNAVEVVRKAVAKKKVIMMDDHNQIMLNPNPAEKNQTSTGIIVRTSCQGYFGLLLMIFFLRKQ
jgi:hypothetical protein